MTWDPREDPRLRYLVSGGSVFAFNMALAWVVFSRPSVEASQGLRNLANVLVAEASLLVAFVLHDRITWRTHRRVDLLRRVWRFHLVSLVGMVGRTLVFALLDYVGAHWVVSTVGSIVVAALCNFVGYSRLVFAAPPEGRREERSGAD